MVDEYLERYLVMFDLGELLDLEMVREEHDLCAWRATIEQANVRTDYLLSRFELLSFNDAPKRIRLVNELFGAGLPVAAPIATLDGMTMTIYSGKPAMLQLLKGNVTADPTIPQCRAFGRLLARLHARPVKAAISCAFPRDEAHARESLAVLAEHLSTADRNFLGETHRTAAGALQRVDGDLSPGIVHGHPLRASVRFAGDEVACLTDFQRAGSGHPLHDLGLTIADWCTNPDGPFDGERCAALLTAYEETRALLPVESDHLRAAATLALCELWIDALLDHAESETAAASGWRRRLEQVESLPRDFRAR